jgi:short-subunit dehydrogenase
MSTALVTGASAGLGRAFAERLAREGTDVVIVARDRGRLEDLARGLRMRHGVAVEVLVADLSDRAATGRVCARIQDDERPVDLLVNNAGWGLKAPFLDNDLADEEAGLDLMVRAVMLTSHAAGRSMRARGHGAILNVSSVAGFVANGTYNAEKAFVTVFTEGLAGELAGTGVTATALCPGFTRTEFHARAGLAMSALPEWLWLDADDVVQQALTDVARGKVVSVPGAQWKVVTTGVRLLPRPLLRGGALRRLDRFRRPAGSSP